MYVPESANPSDHIIQIMQPQVAPDPHVGNNCSFDMANMLPYVPRNTIATFLHDPSAFLPFGAVTLLLLSQIPHFISL